MVTYNIIKIICFKLSKDVPCLHRATEDTNERMTEKGSLSSSCAIAAMSNERHQFTNNCI
jgi:hypothetical protein